MKHQKSMPRRNALLGGLAAVSVVAALPAAGETASLAGIYRAEGRNPDGTTYAGQAVLGQQGNAVQINWTVGTQTYAGSGLLDGRVLTIDWGQPAPVVYVVMPDGTLHGTWNNGTALERLLPQ